MRTSLTPLAVALLAALLIPGASGPNRVAAAVAGPQPARSIQRAATPQTALDRYVAAPDPAYSWKVLSELPAIR